MFLCTADNHAPTQPIFSLFAEAQTSWWRVHGGADGQLRVQLAESEVCWCECCFYCQYLVKVHSGCVSERPGSVSRKAAVTVFMHGCLRMSSSLCRLDTCNICSTVISSPTTRQLLIEKCLFKIFPSFLMLLFGQISFPLFVLFRGVSPNVAGNDDVSQNTHRSNHSRTQSSGMMSYQPFSGFHEAHSCV